MKYYLSIAILISSAYHLIGCQTAFHQHEVVLSPDSKVIFLDSTEASSAIITDEVDFFFERATVAEMEIQMKKEVPCEDRTSCAEAYKAFLSQDVESFTKEEIQKVTAVFENLVNMIKKVNPALLNSDIILIKTKANHYGNSVYYTRENKIIIPKNELENFNESGFTEVMLHEFFHVFSRANPEVRDEIYNLIGFVPVKKEIILPEKLAKTKLLNPDGTTDYAIKLETTDGKEVFAYPLISASEEHYTSEKPAFFNYLVFNLYDLEADGEEKYNLLVNEEGSTTIPFQEIPSFFKKIKDNTSYIIHPDEISADNFVFTVFLLAEDQKLKDFSKEGKKLINDIGEILKAYD